MILPQKYPIEPGGQNFSLREVPAIGTKSEGLGGTLEPTSLSHHHTGCIPFPDLSLLQSETHRLGCLDNGLRNAEGVPPASSLPSPAQSSIRCGGGGGGGWARTISSHPKTPHGYPGTSPWDRKTSFFPSFLTAPQTPHALPGATPQRYVLPLRSAASCLTVTLEKKTGALYLLHFI